jgi:hypothetical protein
VLITFCSCINWKRLFCVSSPTLWPHKGIHIYSSKNCSSYLLVNCVWCYNNNHGDDRTKQNTNIIIYKRACHLSSNRLRRRSIAHKAVASVLWIPERRFFCLEITSRRNKRLKKNRVIWWESFSTTRTCRSPTGVGSCKRVRVRGDTRFRANRHRSVRN